MNRHPFDLTAFVWGIGFLVASAVVMLREWADVTPDVKWDSRGPRYEEGPEPTRVPRIEPPCLRCATRKG